MSSLWIKKDMVYVNVEAKKKNTSQKIYVCQSSDENTIWKQNKLSFLSRSAASF